MIFCEFKMDRKALETWLQLSLPRTGGWGGARANAGRKRHTKELPHETRPEHKERFPVHVTLRIRRGLPSLRRERRFARIKRAFRYGCDKFGMRLCEFSVQHDHIHLIVEALDKRALARGMGALEIRIARGFNKLLGRTGPVFADRYFARVLRTPAEVKTAVHYVRYNLQHHDKTRAMWDLDPFSSVSGIALCFDAENMTVAAPLTWLLRNSS
jgi:REP element-mobilizing transposase RayT